MENKNDEVTIYACKLNQCNNPIFYWRNGTSYNYYEPSDYVIVENKSGYDLAQIVGIIRIKKKDVKYLAKISYDNMKFFTQSIDINEVVVKDE